MDKKLNDISQPDIVPDPEPLHFLEQYSTSSQTLAHFLRHTKGRSQTKQTLVGRLIFFTIFISRTSNSDQTFVCKTTLKVIFLPTASIGLNSDLTQNLFRDSKSSKKTSLFYNITIHFCQRRGTLVTHPYRSFKFFITLCSGHKLKAAHHSRMLSLF